MQVSTRSIDIPSESDRDSSRSHSAAQTTKTQSLETGGIESVRMNGRCVATCLAATPCDALYTVTASNCAPLYSAAQLPVPVRPSLSPQTCAHSKFHTTCSVGKFTIDQ